MIEKNLLTCSNDSTVKLWSLYTNRKIDTIKIYGIPTHAIFNEKGNNILYLLRTEIFSKHVNRQKIESISK